MSPLLDAKMRRHRENIMSLETPSILMSRICGRVTRSEKAVPADLASFAWCWKTK